MLHRRETPVALDLYRSLLFAIPPIEIGKYAHAFLDQSARVVGREKAQEVTTALQLRKGIAGGARPL